MECLLLSPCRYDLMDVHYLMEMPTSLRVSLVQRLLDGKPTRINAENHCSVLYIFRLAFNIHIEARMPKMTNPEPMIGTFAS